MIIKDNMANMCAKVTSTYMEFTLAFGPKPEFSFSFKSTKKAAPQYQCDNGRAASSLLKWYSVLTNPPGTIHAPVWQILTGGSSAGFLKDNSSADTIPEAL